VQPDGRRVVGGYWPAALLVLWALLLFGGFVIGGGSLPEHRMPVWTRLASSIVLVVLAWTQWRVARRERSGGFAMWLAAGMTLGAVGDVVLSGVLPGEDNVLAGIAAFGLGHVCYIKAVLSWEKTEGLTAPLPRRVALAIWLVIGAVGWYFAVYRGQDAEVLHWAALAYALLLAGTAGVTTGLAWQARAFAPMAVGAALFLVSDLMLAAQLFSDLSFRMIGDVIWLTYGPGQMLIVTAATVARRMTRTADSGSVPGRALDPG
jgi:uncharacterized membrane protein YhhN